MLRDVILHILVFQYCRIQVGGCEITKIVGQHWQMLGQHLQNCDVHIHQIANFYLALRVTNARKCTEGALKRICNQSLNEARVIQTFKISTNENPVD